MASQEAIRAIALSTPIIASCVVFATRRMKKGANAIGDDATAYGLLNFDIAAGQSLKGLRAGRALSIASDISTYSSADKITELTKAAKTAEASSGIINTIKNNKILKGVYKVVDKTADNINPIIIAAGGVKVLTADDKIDAFDREAISLGCMFGSEAIAKKVLGMPKWQKNAITGKGIAVEQKSILCDTPIAKGIDKLFGEAQKSALTDVKSTKMFFDKIPADAVKGGLKGACFVIASILGYKLGETIANKLLGEEKPKKAKAN